MKRFHLHKWSEWEDSLAKMDSPLLPRLGTWNVPVQVRHCVICKKKTIRHVN